MLSIVLFTTSFLAFSWVLETLSTIAKDLEALKTQVTTPDTHSKKDHQNDLSKTL